MEGREQRVWYWVENSGGQTRSVCAAVEARKIDAMDTRMNNAWTRSIIVSNVKTQISLIEIKRFLNYRVKKPINSLSRLPNMAGRLYTLKNSLAVKWLKNSVNSHSKAECITCIASKLSYSSKKARIMNIHCVTIDNETTEIQVK